MDESLRPASIAPRALGAVALACLATFADARPHASPGARFAEARAAALAPPPANAAAKKRAKAHVEAARARTLAELSSKGIELPRDFLQWVDGDPLVRASV
ncbi:MAG: hypothetical protein RL112_1239, partial [Planctomycetota bacterium]